MGQVRKVAWQYRYYGIEPEELASAGNLGLMRAVQKFDPDHGVKFETYANYWIRAHILLHVLKNWNAFSGTAGPYRSKLFFRVRREMRRLVLQGSSEADAIELVASKYHTGSEELSRMLSRGVPLDAPQSEEHKSIELVAPGDNPEELFATAQARQMDVETVRDALATLTPRLQFVMKERFLIDDPRSLRSIGEELGVSRERIRQLEARAMNKLRERIRTRKPV